MKGRNQMPIENFLTIRLRILIIRNHNSLPHKCNLSWLSMHHVHLAQHLPLFAYPC